MADSPTPPLPICHLWYEDDLTPTATKAEKIGEGREGEGWRKVEHVRILMREKSEALLHDTGCLSALSVSRGLEDVKMPTRERKVREFYSTIRVVSSLLPS